MGSPSPSPSPSPAPTLMDLLPVSLTLTKTWIPTSVLLEYAKDVTVIMPEPTVRTVMKAAQCIESECASLPSITLLLDRTADKMFLSDGIELLRACGQNATLPTRSRAGVCCFTG